MKLGKIESVEQIGHGVTKPLKVKLELNGARHAGQIQTVDKELPDFYPPGGGPVPMRDSWRFNVAAYKIDRLLNLKMVPVTVQRAYHGKPAALTWWVDDVQFEEIDRIKKKLAAPDPEKFARQRALGSVFDELIINIDRNLANLLITNSWNVVLIDHSRAFTAYPGIRNEEKLTRCSLDLMARLKALAADQVKASVGALLTDAEVRAMLARRDLIVAWFEREAKTKGAGSVLFS
ncbi:MAG: hypothetical protein ABI759_04835 [Candidatus Solibacter sp.]